MEKEKQEEKEMKEKEEKKIVETKEEKGGKKIEEKEIDKKEVKKDEKKEEEKIEEKKQEKKVEEGKGKEKTMAFIRGRNIRISTKHAVAICKAIKRKKIDEAIELLEQVIRKKKAIPMKGELPHRKGIESGRYPEKASKEIIKLLKSLKANAIQNELDVEKARITKAIANIGERPYKRFGRERRKRSHIYLEVGIKKGEEKK